LQALPTQWEIGRYLPRKTGKWTPQGCMSCLTIQESGETFLKSDNMIRRKYRNLIKNIFVQGVSPQKLALTISLGVFIGTIPVLWGSTLICALLAFLFRLNQLSIQAANYLAYPLQIVLIVPFYRIGAGFISWDPSVSPDIFSKGIKNLWMGNFVPMAAATLKALAAWFLIASPVVVLLYFLLWAIFARMPRLIMYPVMTMGSSHPKTPNEN
jgi:uncharacterized protein (DUF2062 family)